MVDSAISSRSKNLIVNCQQSESSEATAFKISSISKGDIDSHYYGATRYILSFYLRGEQTPNSDLDLLA